MNLPLDPFGQQSGLNKLYTQLCLCFPVARPKREETVQLFEAGLQRLMSDIPWLAGRVIYEGDSNRYYIRAAECKPVLLVRNRDQDLPSMNDFRASGCPAKSLSEKLVAPCETVRRRSDEPAPIFLIQANFVNEALLLVVCGLHSCMDMAGQGHITSLFAKACRGEDLSDEEVEGANFRGVDAIPLLDADEISLKAESLAQNARGSPAPKSDSQEASAIWSYITFPGSALMKLKAEAMGDITTAFVSTDDCLSAYLWQAITRARLHRFSSVEIETAFTRTVDARNAAGVPPTYTGNAAVKVACRMTIQQLLDSSLGAVASNLREGLKDVGHKLRLDATLLAAGKPPNKPSVEPSTGVNLSSWAKENTYQLDFGPLLGKPQAVRRPTFQAWESLVYLMPKRDDGEVAAAVCLREEDMTHLKADGVFAEYARFVN